MLIGIDASRAVAAEMSGTEVYSLNVIRELLKLGNGLTYRLYFRDRPSAELGLGGGHVEHRLIRRRRLWTHVGLSWETTVRPPDLLFVPAHVVPIVRRCRTVATIHDVGYLDYPEAYTRQRWWYLHLSTLFNSRVASLLIADSHATKADLVNRYGVRPDKIRVVYLACDEAFVPADRAEAQETVKRRHGISGNYFLYLGTLQPRKNVPRLLKAFADFKAQTGSDHKLVLVGRKGWLFEPIFRSVRELGIECDAMFLGYLPDSELPALLGGALALVFPSLYEGFGLPALQAMACGTPVIASNVSSLPEVVGEAGLLVDPCDTNELTRAMTRVAGDDGLRWELRQRGLARAKLFSWRKCAAETLEVLLQAGGQRQVGNDVEV